MIVSGKPGPTPTEVLILKHLTKMETLMSALTDQIDAALTTLAADTSNVAAIFAAQQAATAAVQSALDASKAQEVADEAELQKALDALTAANAALSALGQPPAAA